MGIPGGATRDSHRALAALYDDYDEIVNNVDDIRLHTLEAMEYADDLIDIVPKNKLRDILMKDIKGYCDDRRIDKNLIPKAADRLMRRYRDRFNFSNWDTLIIAMRQYKDDV